MGRNLYDSAHPDRCFFSIIRFDCYGDTIYLSAIL